MICSISPVELGFKEFLEDNNEHLEKKENEQTETNSKENEQVDVNITSFNHENVLKVKLGELLTKD